MFACEIIEILTQGEFSVDCPPRHYQFLSTTEHEERQVANSMHYCGSALLPYITIAA